jgi:hypothetical protein
MKRILRVIVTLVVLISCKYEKGPDVSNINVKLETVRFERDFFSIDTNNLSNSIQKVYELHPGFFRDFTDHILGIPPLKDSGEQVMKVIKQFIHDYKPIYDSANAAFPDMRNYERQIRNGLKHVKYYFPAYQIPEKLITFIGPMDAYFEGSTGGYGDAITPEGLAIGLQLHLGKDFSLYTSEMGLALYPGYISRKFSPEYIPVNSMKNIIDDIFPDQGADKTLVEQMVEKGKRLYVLDKIMPDTPDTLKIGYSAGQLEGCRKNEGMIWTYFVKNGLVYNNDPSLIKNYIGESPGTPEFGEGAPGNIGLFVGWQIVRKFMEDNETMSLTELMKFDSRKLFEASRYRPR